MLAAAVVAGAVFLAFLPALGAEFLDWDDPKVVVHNPRVQGLSAENLVWAFTSFFAGHYQPLTWISYAVDFEVWGLDPFGFHLTNLLLHCATSVLLLWLVRDVLQRAGRPRDDWVAPVLATLFFAVHPTRVESVAWVTERRDVLCGFFLLASLLCYQLSRFERRRLFAASVGLFALALLSKASAVTFPAVLVCFDLATKRRVRWKAVVPFALVALPFVATALLAQTSATAALSLDRLPLGARFWIASYGLAYYAVQTVWPHGLSALHELPFPPSARDERFTQALVVLGVLAVAGLVLSRRRPEWFRPTQWAACASLAFLLPVLGFFQSGPQLVAERYTYFASLPLVLLLGAALAGRPRRFDRAVLAGGVLALGALAVLTFQTTRTWHDSETLWTRALEVDPACGYCNEQLAFLRLEEGRGREAEVLLRAGLAKLPSMQGSNWALAQILRATGRDAEELVYLNRVLHLRPDFEPAWQETARVLWSLGKTGGLANLLARLPPPLGDSQWARDYRWALEALGGASAGSPPSTAEDLRRVAALLKGGVDCEIPADREIPDRAAWIGEALRLCLAGR